MILNDIKSDTQLNVTSCKTAAEPQELCLIRARVAALRLRDAAGLTEPRR